MSKNKRPKSQHKPIKEEETPEYVEEEELEWIVHLNRKVYEKMLYLARLSKPDEIQMLAEVVRNDMDFVIDSIYLIKQRVSGGHADFDQDSLALFTGSVQHPERIRGWIHSHVDMGTFWSGTDEATIKRICGMGWLLSIVMCVNGDMKARLDVSMEQAQAKVRSMGRRDSDLDNILLIPKTVTWDDLEIRVEEALTADDKTVLDKEFEDKVGRRSESVVVTGPDRQKNLFYEKGSKLYDHELTGRAGAPTISDALDAEVVGCHNCAWDCEGEVCRRGVTRTVHFYKEGMDAVCNGWSPGE